MSKCFLSLSEVEVGKTCQVYIIEAFGNERRRLLDLGLTEGTKVTVLGKSPLGDPISYGIRGIVIALRNESAKKVIVKV